MWFGTPLMRRPGSWALWLAVRSTTTAAIALGAALMLQSTALPRLTEERQAAGDASARAGGWMDAIGARLAYVPLPALAVGVAAIGFRAARPVLAIVAALLALAAVVLVLGTLITALAPMYQIPRELDPG
jgi:hypothetical protein